MYGFLNVLWISGNIIFGNPLQATNYFYNFLNNLHYMLNYSLVLNFKCFILLFFPFCYFRQLFYSTGKLLPNLAFNLGAGENLFNFAYYGLLSPVMLVSYLFIEVYSTSILYFLPRATSSL